MWVLWELVIKRNFSGCKTIIHFKLLIMKSVAPILLIIIMVFVSPLSMAQNVEVEPKPDSEKTYKVRPLRIGAKMGFPNLIGGNIEYVTPFLNKKLAGNVDYSNLNSDWFIANNSEDGLSENVKFSYLEGGVNYYLFKPGKGLYAGMAYNSISFEGSVKYEDGSTDYIDENHNSFAVKLGAKLGGLFYFRPVIGYSFSSLPTSYQVVSVNSSGEKETFREELETEGIPNFLLNGFLANIGFGFAF